MTNTVAITIKASGPSGSAWAAIKADAAKAGASAADAFNEAFKAKADARGTATERLKESGGLGGEDASLMNRLKGYANTPGGIGILGTGNDTSLMSMLKNQIRQMGESGGPGLLSGMSQGGGESTTDMVRQVLTNSVTGNTSSSDFIKQVLTGTGASNTSTTDLIKQVLEGATPGNISTKDIISQVLEGSQPGNISTEDIIRRVVEGQLPGNMDTTDTIHEKIDDSTIKDQGTKDGATYGASFASSLKNKLAGLLGGGSGGAGAGIGGLLTGAAESGGDSGGGGGPVEAISGALDSGGVAGGALPGVAGVSGMAATLTGLAAAAAAVLPGLVSVGGGLGVLGGAFALLDTSNKKFAADMKSGLGSIEGVAESAAASAWRSRLRARCPRWLSYFKSIEPELKEVFTASAPLIQPLVSGIKNLINAVGPGFLAMIKAGAPVMQQFAGGLGDLGHDVGQMFSDFAGAGGSAGVATRAILDLLGDLLPLIGKIGEVMANTMARRSLPLPASSAPCSRRLRRC